MTPVLLALLIFNPEPMPMIELSPVPGAVMPTMPAPAVRPAPMPMIPAEQLSKTIMSGVLE